MYVGCELPEGPAGFWERLALSGVRRWGVLGRTLLLIWLASLIVDIC